MSTRIEIIDTIDSSTASDISVKKKMDYGVSRSSIDYSDTEVPDMGAVREVASSAAVGSYQTTFTGVSTVTINWQTDLIDGTNTYGDILGNNIPRPIVHTGTATSVDETARTQHTELNLDLTIDTVTLDWSFTADGYIRW